MAIVTLSIGLLLGLLQIGLGYALDSFTLRASGISCIFSAGTSLGTLISSICIDIAVEEAMRKEYFWEIQDWVGMGLAYLLLGWAVWLLCRIWCDGGRGVPPTPAQLLHRAMEADGVPSM